MAHLKSINQHGPKLVDLNPISDACHAPQYGQAEDYSIYVYTMNEITSIRNTNNHKNIIITPNPVSKILNIQFESDEKNNYHVLDLQGRVVQTGALKNSTHQIDVSNYRKGVYILSIKTSVSEDKVKKCLELVESTCPVGVLFTQAGVKLKGDIVIL